MTKDDTWLQEECLKCLKSGDALSSFCSFWKMHAGTNLDKISVCFSDIRPRLKRRSKSLFCCKTLKIGSNIGFVEFYCL